MQENWISMQDFPNYEISDLGHIRNKKTKKQLKCYTAKDGYLTVSLCNHGRQYCRKLDNLVCRSFHSKPRGYFVVSHKNGDPADCTADNLYWKRRDSPRQSRPVYAYDKDGQLIDQFTSATEAALSINGSAGSIRNVCCGMGNTYRGLQWSYFPPKERDLREGDRDFEDSHRAVYQYEGAYGNEVWVHTWDNYMEAAHALDINPDSILQCCRGSMRKVGGYSWDFADKYFQEENT